MKRPTELLRGILESPSDIASDRVRGRFAGHDVEVRLVDRGAGSTRDPHTEVWFLGAAVRDDLRLHVVPQTADDVSAAAAGAGTDVVTGDRAFDDAYFVEAAPADVVTRLFDDTIRATMTRLGPLAVHTRDEGLLVERAGWLDDATTVGALVALGGLLVDEIPRAFVDADRAAQSRTGYRVTTTREALADERREQVAEVMARRDLRARRQRMVGCLLGLFVFAAAIVVALVSLVRRVTEEGP